MLRYKKNHPAVYVSKFVFALLSAIEMVIPAQAQMALLELDEFSSKPAIVAFSAVYVDLLKNRNYAEAASQTLVFLSQHPNDRPEQIVGEYLWSLATLSSGVFISDAALRERVARLAIDGLKRSSDLIQKLPSTDRSGVYARLEQKLIPLYTIQAADLAGSRTEVIRLAERLISEDPDGEYSQRAALCMISPRWGTQEDDKFTSYLVQLATRFKGKKVAAPILYHVGLEYLRKGENDLFLEVLETLKTVYPNAPYWRRLEAARELRRSGASTRTKQDQATGAGCDCDDTNGCHCP